MKKILKGLVITTIISSIISGATFTAEAEPINNSSLHIVNAMEERVTDILFTYYGDSIVESSSVAYGNRIPVYNYIDDVISESETLKFYPVYINNELKGYIRETINSGVSYLSYSEEFVTKVNDLGENEYNFICTEDSFYISSENGIQLLSENSYDEDKVSVIATRIGEISLDSLLLYSCSSSVNSINSTSTNRANDDNITYSLNIPKKSLTAESGLCWAGCVEAVGEYMTNNKSLEPAQIAQYMGIGSEGAYNSDVKTALSYYYNISTENSTNIPVFSYMVSKINNGKPIIANLQSQSKGHYMTIIGYGATSSKFYVKVMDTLGGTYRVLELKDGVFSYRYTTETFTWSSAVIPNAVISN